MTDKLPEEIQDNIKYDAQRYTKDEGYQKAYTAGATAWAQWKVKYDELNKELDKLVQWKKEATELLAPIIEYGQQVTPLAKSTTEFVLQRAKKYDELQAQAQNMADALEKIKAWHSPGHSAAWAITHLKNIAIQALQPFKDGTGREVENE